MRSTYLLALGSLLAIVAAACGSSVETNNGTGGNALCAQEVPACCSQSPGDPCCRACDTTTGTGAGGVGGMGGTGGTGGATCGGIAGLPCAADEFCDFPDDQCGGDDGTGVCTKRPITCPDSFAPTCGCDGQVYSNSCDAQSVGADLSNLGGCMAPAGMFGCGAHFCTLGMDYCEKTLTDVGGTPSSFVCKVLPTGCTGSADCACLVSSVNCGSTCQTTSDGGSMVVCPGG